MASDERSDDKGTERRHVSAADAPEVVRRVHDELDLVDLIARQLRRQLGGRVAHDDLVSFGREGLLGAARSFDPSLGVAFRRWANYRVRGAMIDGIRKAGGVPRSVYSRLRALEAGHHASEAAAEDGSARPCASAAEADARLEGFLAGIASAVAVGFLASAGDGGAGDGIDAAPTAEELLVRSETMVVVREAMAALPDPERHLVQRHYFDDLTLDEAAHEIGLSRSWGCRLHGRAIEAITRHLKRARVT